MFQQPSAKISRTNANNKIVIEIRTLAFGGTLSCSFTPFSFHTQNESKCATLIFLSALFEELFPFQTKRKEKESVPASPPDVEMGIAGPSTHLEEVDMLEVVNES